MVDAKVRAAADANGAATAMQADATLPRPHNRKLQSQRRRR